MRRQIIHIDQDKCNGCGLCAQACHEGAIEIIDGKAQLVREHFCDGLGDCLPNCPTGAISFETREAPEYDHAAVMAAKAQKEERKMEISENVREKMAKGPGGCTGSAVREMARADAPADVPAAGRSISRLAQWPCQIKLVPVQAPFFQGAKLLIAADCTAYAYASVHEDFMRGKVTLIGCPKLDAVNYAEKLTEILRSNDIRSVTVLRMEVPCCGGLEFAVKTALQESGKFIPWQVVTISIDGKILDD